MRDFKITNTEGGAALIIILTTGAKQNKVVSKDDEVVHIDLTTAGDDVEIDRQLVRFLATKLGIHRERIATTSSKKKNKRMEGIAKHAEA